MISEEKTVAAAAETVTKAVTESKEMAYNHESDILDSISL
eukprot:COSAG01_NODE_76464_length_184_cov_63.270588_1_plen_40_part_00